MKSARNRPAAEGPTAAAVPASPRRAQQTGGFGLRPVAGLVPGITRKAFEKHGFAAAALITDWREIVGEALARTTRPEKLKWPRGVETYGDLAEGERGRPGATLTLRVDPAGALEVQYRTSQIVERINGYFGYRAVTDLRLVQGTDAEFAASLAPTIPAPHHPRHPAKAPAQADLANIADDQLRAALERLAASIGQSGGTR